MNEREVIVVEDGGDGDWTWSSSNMLSQISSCANECVIV